MVVIVVIVNIYYVNAGNWSITSFLFYSIIMSIFLFFFQIFFKERILIEARKILSISLTFSLKLFFRVLKKILSFFF